MGVLVERFEQAGAVVRSQALAVQQGRRGLQRGGVFAVEDFVPVEAQRAVIRPLVAVEQKPLVQADDNDVARRERRLRRSHQRRWPPTFRFEGLAGQVSRRNEHLSASGLERRLLLGLGCRPAQQRAVESCVDPLGAAKSALANRGRTRVGLVPGYSQALATGHLGGPRTPTASRVDREPWRGQREAQTNG